MADDPVQRAFDEMIVRHTLTILDDEDRGTDGYLIRVCLRPSAVLHKGLERFYRSDRAGDRGQAMRQIIDQLDQEDAQEDARRETEQGKLIG
jgi:hypothetical protein